MRVGPSSNANGKPIAFRLLANVEPRTALQEPFRRMSRTGAAVAFRPSLCQKNVKLDPSHVQALSLVTLHKVGKPTPELKELPLAGQADALGVDAVMETFVQEADVVAKHISEDAHPKAASKPARTPAKQGTSKPK